MKKQWPENWKEYNLAGIVFEVGNSRTFKQEAGVPKSLSGIMKNVSSAELCYLYLSRRDALQEDELRGISQPIWTLCKGCGICAHECWPNGHHNDRGGRAPWAKESWNGS